MAEAILEVVGLTKAFLGLKALEDVTLSARFGEITGLIGPNGAGKTTFFNCVAGVMAPSSGTVSFNGHAITGLKPHEVARLGIARTFQNIRLFSEMTVLENVIIGRSASSLMGAFLGAMWQGRAFLQKERQFRDRAMDLLKFVGLSGNTGRLAKHLSYGDQKRLEIARALGTQPKLLLLDEPAAGMNPRETETLMELIQKVKNEGITPFLIEHNMKMVMGVCDHLFVLDHGVKIAEGNCEAVRSNPAVIDAYLGRPKKIRHPLDACSPS